ncbi:TadE family protein [Massilia sp. DD77]|uniref:TadE family protein n=1 Tax=Massilia sp. DD77 TaxID=3109349 RepID=UPI002FFF7F3F
MHSRSQASHTFQTGSAAVELAFILPMLLVFLTAVFFISRVTWHYTAAQKAATDAARYLSSISTQEMREPELAEHARNVALAIVQMEMADLNPGGRAPRIEIFCGEDACDGFGSRPLPETVEVRIKMDMVDPLHIFDTGRYGVPLTVNATMAYVGGGL